MIVFLISFEHLHQANNVSILIFKPCCILPLGWLWHFSSINMCCWILIRQSKQRNTIAETLHFFYKLHCKLQKVILIHFDPFTWELNISNFKRYRCYETNTSAINFHFTKYKKHKTLLRVHYMTHFIKTMFTTWHLENIIWDSSSTTNKIDDCFH